MSKTDFFRVNATERQDQVVRLSDNNYLLIYGFGKADGSDEQGYNWRKYYDHRPTAAELKEDIIELVNSITDAKILSGFVWNSINVWLSTENQFNFKAAYDIAVQTGGQNLPLKMKLGEDADGNAQYHTFEDVATFADFYVKAMAYITQTLNAGWDEKDGIDCESLLSDE